MDTIKQGFLLLRPSHWSKSLFVLLGVFYSQAKDFMIPALFAALAFSLISSAVYIYNDIQDRSEDSLHPNKKFRPLASNQVALSHAAIALFGLLISGLILGWIISKPLALILSTYLLINLAYNHLLKLIPILDVLCIASGFMLRVLAGTIGIGLPISIWLTLATTLVSLFIALNKRRLELQLGLNLQQPTRQVLEKYSPILLDRAIVITGSASFITYLLYTLYAHADSFYFIVTLPFAAFALWRFAFLSTGNVDNDDPVNVFLHDRLSRFNLYCFIILTFMALSK